MHRWLQFFRIVNLPTVPGDVFVGAAAVIAGVVIGRGGALDFSPSVILAAAVASCAIYLFGLADNDIVGAAQGGPERPIPSGAISLPAARVARGLCLFAALIIGAAMNLPPMWWIAAFLLAVCVVVYNRTKWCLAMGLCRGLDVICGGAALLSSGCRGEQMWSRYLLLGAAIVWLLYISAVTIYSKGEEDDPVRRRRVGFLIGAIIYLQLIALFVCYYLVPTIATRNLLLAGAGMLIALRFLKRTLPKVSAS